MGIFPRGIVRINGKPLICDNVDIDVILSESGPKRIFTLTFTLEPGIWGIARRTHMEMHLMHDDFSMEEHWGIYRVIESRMEVDAYGSESCTVRLSEVMADTQSIYDTLDTSDQGPH